MTQATPYDPFKSRAVIDTPMGPRTVFRLDALHQRFPRVKRLPYSILVLLEACLRHCDGKIVTEEDVAALANYDPKNIGDKEIPFMPGRVVLQDFTGVPAVVDLAAMRSAMSRVGGDPRKVNPLVPCDLVVDHSVQVDAFGSASALSINARYDFERNLERYTLLKWAQKAFNNFRVVPPATGIVHQVNLEYLAKVVWEGQGPRADGPADASGSPLAHGPSPLALFPDSLVGTDSHTTMINGLGVVGWGVGGIEAEAVMLGQPIYMRIPQVIGLRLTGALPEGATATDMVLTVTQMLRKRGVVECFVECFGSGLAEMAVANRATIANMAPEYGATIGFFPVDAQTLTYMRLTGRDARLIAAVEQYYKLQQMWLDPSAEREYSDVLELDLGTIEPSLAGPRRPQDRVALTDMQSSWRQELPTFMKAPAGGAAPARTQPSSATATLEAPSAGDQGVSVTCEGSTFQLKHGHVVLAAITSCTNTSNPEVMLAAGLIAQKADRLGLTRKPWVKTSLAPGSKVVTEYYIKAGLMPALEALGFYLVGYGCTTCIGNSGPLPGAISKAINENDLAVASVLSGNRNFEGRIHPDVKANYLASPPLVVLYALAGTVDIDITREPITRTPQGTPVYLRDLWPTSKEVADVMARCVTREDFIQQYADVFKGPEQWQAIDVEESALYPWDEKSTYVQEPPFFVGLQPQPEPIATITGARCLAKLGDSITTDHISPAGSIKKDSPAGKYLIEQGVPLEMFNSYGARRGNDRVMTRGTFANTRIKNQLAGGAEGGVTLDFTDGTPGKIKPIYDAAMSYRAKGVPLVVLAGKDYGMGSSRDWAAKGTFLLGVKAVIADSYERIHRSNLVGMGVLPLTYKPGQTAASLGLKGDEIFDIAVDDAVRPRQEITVTARRPDHSGSPIKFVTMCRIDTPVEVDYYRNGGILHTVLRRMNMPQ